MSTIVGINFANSQPTSINGCVDKKSGLIRIANKCKTSERVTTWAFTGPMGIQGEKGKTGPRGKTGKTGARGIPGTSVLSGVGTPSIELGKVGDFYLDTSTYKLYGPKNNIDWGVPKDLVGPQGPSGSNGASGPAGAQGKDGQTIELNDGSFAQLVLANTSTDVYQVKFSNGYVWSFREAGSTIIPKEVDYVSRVFFTETSCAGTLYYQESTPELDKFFVYKSLVKIPNPIDSSTVIGGQIFGKLEYVWPAEILFNSYLSGISGDYVCTDYSSPTPFSGIYFKIEPILSANIPNAINRPFTLRP
jgi:hypothetical protein